MLDYNFIPESKEGDPEAQVNATILNEAPDQSPEEPKANLVSDYLASTGHNPVFQIITIYCYYLCIYSSYDLNWNPRCMILGTYVLNTRPEFE